MPTRWPKMKSVEPTRASSKSAGSHLIAFSEGISGIVGSVTGLVLSVIQIIRKKPA